MNRLISLSLQNKDVHLLLGFPRELMSVREKEITEWVTGYISCFGEPPSLKRASEQFPHYLMVGGEEDPLGDVYEQTLVRKRNLYTRDYMTRIQDELKRGVDPLPYIEELHSVIRAGKSDVTRYTTYDRSAYYRRPTSFPYEIPQLDQYTGGIAAGDLIYLIGRLGTGKTTFALWVLSKWLQRGRRVLMVSNENRADDVIAKIDSYVGGFNPIKKRTMEWTEEDLSKLKTVTYIAQHMDGEVFVPNKPVQDVKELTALLYTYKPDIVIVDGIYLMNGVSGNSHWEKITEISRSLKQLAEGEGVPVLGIHQASRNAVGRRIEVEHVAYADALAQDADLLLAINPEEETSLVFVEAKKNRWGKKDWGFFVKFHFDTMYAKVLDAKTAVGEGEAE